MITMGRIWSREPAISLADDHHPEPQARAVALEFVIIAVFIYSMDNFGVIVYTRGFASFPRPCKRGSPPIQRPDVVPPMPIIKEMSDDLT